MTAAVLVIIFASIFTEALTELVIKSAILAPIRKLLGAGSNTFRGTLLSCGHCFSLWAAIFPTYYAGYLVETPIPYYFEFVLLLLIVHRIANYIHDARDKYLDKFYSKDHFSNPASFKE